MYHTVVLVFVLLVLTQTTTSQPVVGLLTNGFVTDGNFNQLGWEGAFAAVNASGGTLLSYDGLATGEFAAKVDEFVNAGAVHIMMLTTNAATATQTSAVKYPNVHFGLVDTSIAPMPNVQSIIFSEDHGGYLAAVLASYLSQSKIVGFIGGIDVLPVRRYRNAYTNSVKAYCPTCKVITNYIPSFTDVVGGAAMAQYYISLGVDVIFAAGGITGSSSISAAAGAGILVIGVGDEYLTTFKKGLQPGSDKLLTSIRKGTYSACYSSVTATLTNTFVSGTKIFDLTNGGITLAPCRGAACDYYSNPLKARIEAVQAGLGDGSLRTGVTYSTGAQIINIQSDEWQDVKPAWAPTARSQHTMQQISTSNSGDPYGILLFGGSSESGNMNDLWYFSIIDQSWTQIFPKTNTSLIPNSRAGHVAVSYVNTITKQQQMWIFGGRSGINRLDDAWIYTYATNTWVQVNNSQSASAPTGRDLHCATLISSNKILVFGGNMNNQEYSSEVWLFDLEQQTWELVDNMVGDMPPASISSSLVTINNIAYLYGGEGATRTLLDTLYSFDLSTKTWVLITPTGSVPTARSEHVSVVTGNIMWIFGGNTNEGDTTQIWSFNTNDHKWTLFTGAKSVSTPVASSGHAGIAYQNGLDAFFYTFGGSSPFGRISSTSLYQMTKCFIGNYSSPLCTFESTCAAGEILDVASATCVACPAGSYQQSIFDCSLCSKGYYQPNSGQGACLPCPPGSYGNTTGLTSCNPCGYGNTQSGYAAVNCTLCGPGEFSDVIYGSSCKLCGVNEYSGAVGAAICQKCPINSQTLTVGVSSVDSCFCSAGHYKLDGECVSCMVGAHCEGGNTPPKAAPGYWTHDNTTYSYVSCTPTYACLGGEISLCADGYIGDRCGACNIPSFYRNGDNCEECVSPNHRLLLATFVIVVAVALLILLVFFTAQYDTIASIPISLNFIQVVGIMASFRLHWGGVIIQLLQVFSSANFNLDVFSFECNTGPINYYAKWAFFILLPLLFVGLLIVFYAVRIGYIKYYKHENVDKTVLNKEGARFIGAFVAAMSIGYLMLVSKAFEPLRCTKLENGIYYMDVSPADQCYSESWWRFLAASIIAIIIYSIGVPLVFYYFVRKHRNNLDDNTTRQRYGFIYTRYRKTCYWWFFAEMVRKIGIVLALVFFSGNTIYQVLFFFLVTFFYSMLQVYWEPYRYSSANFLEMIHNYVIILVLFFGLMFYTEKLPTLLPASTLVILSVAIALIFSLGVLFAELAQWLLPNKVIKMDSDETRWQKVIRKMATLGKTGYREL